MVLEAGKQHQGGRGGACRPLGPLGCLRVQGTGPVFILHFPWLAPAPPRPPAFFVSLLQTPPPLSQPWGPGALPGEHVCWLQLRAGPRGPVQGWCVVEVKVAPATPPVRPASLQGACECDLAALPSVTVN